MSESTLPEGQQAPAPEDNTSAPVVEGWRSELPAELQSNESLKNFKDVPSLAKSFAELKSMQGRSIHLLPEDASPEQRAEQQREIMEKIPGYMPKPDFENSEQSDTFWQTLGTPQKPEDYKLPEGATDEISQFNPIAHKAKLTQEQHNIFMSEIVDAQKEQREANEAAFNSAVKELRTEWGQAYEDKHGQALHMAKVMADTTGITGDYEQIASGTAHPIQLKMYAAMYDMVGSEGSSVAKDNNVQNIMTPAQAQEKIDAINNNPEHPYWKVASGTPERERLDKMMTELMDQVNVANTG